MALFEALVNSIGLRLEIGIGFAIVIYKIMRVFGLYKSVKMGKLLMIIYVVLELIMLIIALFAKYILQL